MQLAGGALLLSSYALNSLVPNGPFEPIFAMNTKAHILVEAANIFLVYSAASSFENTENEATNFSYVAATIGIVMSLGINFYAGPAE